MNPAYAIPAVAVVVLATVLIGGFGLRLSRTTSDFYVASRSVGPGLNAAAISGEYLSAASFLGVAGLLLVHGPDMLWYPVGYTASTTSSCSSSSPPRCAAPARTPSPTSPRAAWSHGRCGCSSRCSWSAFAGSTSSRSSRAPG